MTWKNWRNQWHPRDPEKAQPGQPRKGRPQRNRQRKQRRQRLVSPLLLLRFTLDELTEVPSTKEPEILVPTQRLADGMTSTPNKRPRTTDSSSDKDSFQTIQRKKKQQSVSPPQARKPTTQPAKETTMENLEERRTRPARIPPLVIEGPLVENMSSPTELRKVIRIRVTKTQAGTFVLHCRTDEDRLEALTNGSKHQLLRETYQANHSTTSQHRPPGRGSELSYPHQSRGHQEEGEREVQQDEVSQKQPQHQQKITTNNEAERDHLLENCFPFEGVKY